MASEYHGQVTFAGSPVPGATVIATQGDKKLSVVTDTQGTYFFADLPDGTWKITVEMRFFKTQEQDVTVGANGAAGKWELQMLPADQIMAETTPVTVQATVQAPSTSMAAVATKPAAPKAPNGPQPQAPAQPAASAAPAEEKPSDGFLISGSVNNAATSQFSLAPAFGNQRSNTKSLYTGGFAAILDNSALDARPYNTTGVEAPKSSYNAVTGIMTFGGPLNIKHLMPRGPNFFLAFQIVRGSTATVTPGIMPTMAQRDGNFAGLLNAAGQPVTLVNPATGVPYANNMIPVGAVAQSLLAYYPLPNIPTTNGFNYQLPILSSNDQEAMQMRLNKNVTRKDNVDGGFQFRDVHASGANIFGFVDKTNTLGLFANINEHRRLTPRLYLNVGYVYSRLRTQVIPYFSGVTNVSGMAGMAASPAAGGNLQDPTDWGPPTLSFSDGINGLTDGNSTFNRNATNEVTASVNWYHGKHNVTVALDFQRKEFNDLAQTNPRGVFGFTGQGAVTTGYDFADFLLGVPATSNIAFGNADKYFRQSVYAIGATDDWRIRPELTINAGVRWEYGAPMTELKNRLVNLDIAPGFTNEAAVLASQPVGSLTGTHYPTSLVRPDKNGFQPRVGLSWRPIAGSTLVVKAGYGIYADTSVYNTTSLNMAQQAPLSTSLQESNVLIGGLPCETLASGFNPCAGTISADSFAVDPNFRVGYAQTWQLLAQRDLPGSMQGTLTYLGIKGTRGVQQFYPNSYPIGGTSPCAGCPSGYVYRTSGGDSTRESIQGQLRRRLKNGFTASVSYTYSKSIDDDAVLGGQGPIGAGATSQTTANASVAQNWLDLRAERALSTFDQRNLLSANIQYTSGQGIGGGSLMEGWRGTLLKEWTIVTSITAGSGLPQTPIYQATVPGTGQFGSIRGSLTGQPIYTGGAGGRHLNQAAYCTTTNTTTNQVTNCAPPAGQWGTAGRDSIEGPGQFSLNSSLARTFRLKGRYNLDTRVDATNTLNHVVFSSWATTVNSSLFGTPVSPQGMRSLQITMRLRY
jgi:hypothetical protein